MVRKKSNRDLVNCEPYENNTEAMWHVAVLMIDKLLNAFNMTIIEKCAIMETLKTQFATEFSLDKNRKILVDLEYRMYSGKIKQILQQTNSDIKTDILTLVDEWEGKLKVEVEKILNVYNNNMNTISIRNLLSSCIHMSVNRIFRSKQRHYELVIYTFLWKYYKSNLAYNKNK